MEFREPPDRLGDLANFFTDLLTDREWYEIRRLRSDVEQLRASKDQAAWSAEDRLAALSLELAEQRLRFSALVQLLVAKKVVAADELAALILGSRTDNTSDKAENSPFHE